MKHTCPHITTKKAGIYVCYKCGYIRINNAKFNGVKWVTKDSKTYDTARIKKGFI